MSASKKKKLRQELSPEELAELELKQQAEAKAAKRSSTLYLVVGILSVVLVAFLLIWRTGLIQRNATAATVNGEAYSVGDVQYHFNNNVQNVYTMYYQMIGMPPFSSSTSLKAQVYSQETGESWFDTLMDQTLESMAINAAIADRARSEGHILSADAQAYLDSALADLKTASEAGKFSSVDEYVKANYGPYTSYDRVVELFTENLLVQDYISTVTNGFTYSDSDYKAYYEENADQLDSFDITQFVLEAKAVTTDDQGKAIEMTEEEKTAALDASKAEMKALAEEIQAKLEAGEDADALLKEYEDHLYGYTVDAPTAGNSINTSYSEWAYDSARKTGDVTLAEYDGGSSYYYYVVRFEDRSLDQAETHNVRHILIQPEKDEGATEATAAQLADAKTKADSLLKEWKSGEATEESFSALAMTNSADSTAADGGLIPNVTSTSNYVESFRDWATDSSRKTGDTGVVESVFGYHVMYYVSSGDPIWKLTADSALRSDDYAAWEEEVSAGYEATPGFGLKFIEG